MSLVTEMLWTAIRVTLPVLGVVMIVGLVVSILQVVTQIQEMTLAFVPKLIAAALTLVILGPWMVAVVARFSTALIANIPNYL